MDSARGNRTPSNHTPLQPGTINLRAKIPGTEPRNGGRESIPSEYNLRLWVRPRTNKRGRRLSGFETLKEVKKRLRQRVRRLCEHGEHGDDLGFEIALSLYTCTKTTPCESLACPRCARTRRIRWGASVLEFLAAYPAEDLRFLTLINPADALPAGELHTFDPRKLIHRLRRQLERAGIDKSESFLIGAVDGEWDEGWTVFQPHIHLITSGITKYDLKRLIKPWPRDPERIRVRKRLEEIDDLPRVVAYLDKSWWPCVARKNNPFEIYPHGKQRPPKPIEREILQWFHRHQAAELRLMFGIKSYRGKLVKGGCVHTKTKGGG